MKKVIIILMSIIIISIIYITYVSANTYWTGNNIYDEDTINKGVIGDKYWNITPDRISKVTEPGRVYSFNDITSFSAYVSNNTYYIGNYMPNSFYWYNYSRLLYVKLFKVLPGQEISFIFSNSYYAYCAEYDSKFYLVNDGQWITTGEKVRLKNTTSWIMVVFRQDNGNPSNGSGTDTSICSEEIKNQINKYIVFSPFRYTFNPNGGQYSGSSNTFYINRLGVEKITLPIPLRAGYNFSGWKSSAGDIYNGTLDKIYNVKLFKDELFTAQWNQIYVSNVDIIDENVNIDLTVGNKYKLEAKVLPLDALNKNLIWSVSDESIATVDQSGNVTALKAGKCYVTATAADGSGVYDKCAVNIIRSDVTADYNNRSVVMEAGEKYTPNIKVNYVNGANTKLTYSTDNSKIATVDSQGNITAIAQGIANITVRTSTGYSDTITVYVTSYNVLIPAYIEPDNTFKLGIEIKYNGDENSLHRRTVDVSLESISQLQRIGDINTNYILNLSKNKDRYSIFKQKETLVESDISTSEEFIITTASPIIKAGDYSGNIQLNISSYY